MPDDPYLVPDADAPRKPRGTVNLDELINRHAQRTGLDPEFVKRVVVQESGGKPHARSWAGASGLGQLMPGTARRYGVRNPTDPDENLRGATDYLKDLTDEFKDPEKVLAAYNAGEGAVRKYGYDRVRRFSNFPKGDPRRGGYAGSTGAYVDKILKGYGPQQQRPTDPYLTPDPYLVPDAGRDSGASASTTTPLSSPPAAEAVVGATGVGTVQPGRFAAMARARPVRRRPHAPAADPAADFLSAISQAGGAATEQVLDRKRPKVTSRADIMRAEEAPQPSSGTIPRGVDPRLLKGEQPSDPMAYLRAQELVGRTEPAKTEVYQPPMPGQLEAAQAQTKQNAELTRRAIAQAAPPGFEYLPKDLQEWIGGGIASSAGSLATQAAGIYRDRFAVSPVNRLTNAVGSKLTGVDAGERLMSAGNILSQGAAAMDEESKRGIVSQLPKDILFGSISSAPAMALAALGVPAPIAFGLQGYLNAEGRGAELSDTITETGTGATIGALFELPTPAKLKILSQIGEKIGPRTAVVGQAVERALPVGVGTYGIETAIGSPHAIQSAAVNALFAGSGAIKHRRGVRDEGKVERSSDRPEQSSDMLSDADSITPQDRPISEAGQTPALRPPEVFVRPEGPPDAVPVEARPATSTTEPVTQPRWQHRDFGQVTQSENQAGVGRGRVRVTAEDGTEHVIQRPKGTGAGNQIAIPIREQGGIPSNPTERPIQPLTPESVPQPRATVKPVENLQSQEAVRGQEPAASPARGAQGTRIQQLKDAGYVPVARRQAQRGAIQGESESVFFTPFEVKEGGPGESDYGPALVNRVIDKNAKIYNANSSYEFALDRGLVDKPDPIVKQETGFNSIREMLDAGADPEGRNPLNDGFPWFRALQKMAARELKKEGYQGVFWHGEDALSPNQYQVWDRGVLKRAGEITSASKALPSQPAPKTTEGAGGVTIAEKPLDGGGVSFDVKGAGVDMVNAKTSRPEYGLPAAINDIYIKPEAQRKGLGYKILTDVLDRFRKHGDETFYTTTQLGPGRALLAKAEREGLIERVGEPQNIPSVHREAVQYRILPAPEAKAAAGPSAAGRLGSRTDYDRIYPPGSEKRTAYEAGSRKAMDEKMAGKKPSVTELPPKQPAAPKPPSPLKPEPPPPPSTTSARREPARPTVVRNESLREDAAELGLPELEQARSPREAKAALDEATKANAADPRAPDVLIEQGLRGKNWNDTETLQVGLRIQEVKNRIAQVKRELVSATDATVIRDKSAEYESLVDDYARIKEAGELAGAEWSAAGRARQVQIGEDYTYEGLVARAKSTLKRDLTPEQKAKYKEQADRIVELETKLTQATEAAANTRIQKEIGRIQRQTKRSETKAVLDAEFAALKQQLSAAKLEVKESPVEYRQGGIGLASLDPSGKLTPIIIRMARNRVKAGVTDATQLVDDVYSAVSEHVPAVTARDIRDAISGYGLTPKDRRSELAKQLADIRSELKSLSSQEDVAAGIRTERRAGPTRGEARKLPMEGPRKGEARTSGVPMEGPRLSDATGRKEGPQLGSRQGPRLAEGVGKSAGPQMGERQGPSLREGTSKPEGPSLGPRQGPQKSEASKLPAEGPPRQLFSRDVARRKQLLEQQAELERRLREGDFSVPKRPEPLPYTRETARIQRQVDEIKVQFNRELYRSTRSMGGKITDELAKAANVPKTIKSIGDISAVFRQGGFYAITHPVKGLALPFRDMVKSFSDAGYRNVENTIKSHPKFEQSVKDGVDYTGVNKDDPHLSRREEGFISSEYLDKVPVLKQVKDFSERTFVSFLDSQRLNMYDTLTDGLANPTRLSRLMGAKGGMSRAELAADRQRIAKAINSATGRGNLTAKGNQIAPALNIFMFSPRLLKSRVELLNNMFNPVAWATMPRNARAQILQDNVKFIGATIGVLTLAKSLGAEVNYDPDSSEFLKIRAGNTTYDTLAGLQQPMRYIINMARAASPWDSETLQAGPTMFTGQGMWEQTVGTKRGGGFLPSKASPGFGAVIESARGADFMGRKRSYGERALDLVMPLPADDVREAFKEDGIIGVAKALPSLTGIGVGTYPPPAEVPTTHAEKLIRKMIRDKMPDVAREEEEIEQQRNIADLRARARKGENVAADVNALQSQGVITERQANNITSAREETRLQSGFKRLSLRDAMTVYRVMSADEKKSTREILKKKAKNVNDLPLREQRDIKQRLTAMGIPF